jgi:hypothetical protein
LRDNHTHRRIPARARLAVAVVIVALALLATVVALAVGSSATEPRTTDLPSVVTTRSPVVADASPVTPAPAAASRSTSATATAAAVPAASPVVASPGSPPASVRPAGGREIVEPAVRESDDGAPAKGGSGD